MKEKKAPVNVRRIKWGGSKNSLCNGETGGEGQREGEREREIVGEDCVNSNT